MQRHRRLLEHPAQLVVVDLDEAVEPLAPLTEVLLGDEADLGVDAVVPHTATSRLALRTPAWRSTSGSDASATRTGTKRSRQRDSATESGARSTTTTR